MATARMGLGAHLARLRKATGLSIQQVQQASGGEVSHPYVCQLETGKAKNPSPKKLRALAEVYGTSFEDLMRQAGHLPSRTKTSGRRQARTFAIQGLTREELRPLLEHLAAIRKYKKR
jgi:transcriptional regulator with XRE-family HTH domain